MTSVLTTSDEAVIVGPYGNPDLRFIDMVLADMMVFARLNGLRELEHDLEVAHARFVAQVGRSNGARQLTVDVAPAGGDGARV